MAPHGPAPRGFDATYGAMLGGFWRFAAAARGEAWTALRQETLVCAVAALRDFRKGVLVFSGDPAAAAQPGGPRTDVRPVGRPR